MKILWLSYYYLPHVGGGTWGTYHLTSRLSNRGHKVQLIIPNVQHRQSLHSESSLNQKKRNSSVIHRTPAFLIPREIGPLISSVLMFLGGLRWGKDADIIVFQYHPHHLLCPIAILLKGVLRKAIVLRADDVFREMGQVRGVYAWVVKFVNLVNRFFMKYVDVFLVVCSEHKKILASELGKSVSDRHIHLSHNGVDLSEFSESLHSTKARELLNIKSNEKVLLFVGRYSGAEYGIEILLRAFRIVLQKIPTSILILVGDELSQNQQSLVDSLGVHGNIRTYGPKAHEEVIDFIVASDLCIAPLMSTLTIPLKVLEYMAHGKPMLAGTRSVSKDIGLDASNCIMVSPHPQSIAKGVLNVLQDEDYARWLGSNAKKIATRFSWDKVTTDLERSLTLATKLRSDITKK